ncbi:Gfo/Idh/MocA family oxidoreductase [Bacillus sp. FJAT-49732]|uniref:Gfo/Idh/MocA family oxidoreductase n=1 Tax=Lederbergia citrisecunda TaxID=2833583 RepID=A0A942TKB0_9BACI|nr:Gfo/Idh/MocA family oxidoreductase [Lederbergia citrisecunda]MBS4198222.1 Gfo/Idh/MocA family oxidoreductase [Lederbergia citrisecunda]
MDKVKVGFVGVGGIASVHLKNVSENEHAEIVAVCDINEENAKKQGEAYNASIYTDFDLMLENEHLDALFLSIPPFAHGEIEEKAVQKGIHLFVEKPVELDLEVAKKKANAIRESGVINASGYCLRYLDTIQKAKEYLADKKIAMVRGQYISSFVQTPWYRIMSKSGGQLVEQSTHVMDLMTYLAGDIEKVSANMSLQVMDDIEHIDIPDVTSVNVTFSSGAVGHLDSSFTQPDHRMGVEVLGRDFRVELVGTNLKIVEKDDTETIESKVDFYEVQDRAFIEAVRTKNQDLILASYEDGLKTLAVTLAANQSNQEDKAIRLADFN